jgi:DUF177 domain-containing protein
VPLDPTHAPWQPGEALATLMPGLRIDVADLLAHPGARRAVALDAPVEALVGSSAVIEAPVHVEVSLERVSDGIVVRGTVTGHWRAECSVCLVDIGQDLTVHVDELFEPAPIEGETYPLEGHELDLDQLARDALLLELPLAPHCTDPCAADPVSATHPDDREPSSATEQAEEPRDPRWAPLAELEL